MYLLPPNDTTVPHLGLHVLAVVFICMLVYQSVVFPVFVSPLARIPRAHFLCSFSSLWILWVRFFCDEVIIIEEKHRKYGPLLRVGPQEVSVATLQGQLKVIMERTFVKPAWYSRFCNYHGTRSMFTMLEHEDHSRRKRVASGLLTPSFLQKNEYLHMLFDLIVVDRYRQLIDFAAEEKRWLEMREINDAAAFDLMSGFAFGSTHGTNLLRDAKSRQTLLFRHYKERSQGMWKHEFPRMAVFFRWLNLDLTSSAARWMERWIYQSYAAAKGDAGQTVPPLLLNHFTLRSGDFSGKALNVDKEVNADAELLAEIHDHTVAGAETTGQIVTHAVRQLSERPDLQTELRAELATCATHGSSVPRYADLSRLRLLHAIVVESLRFRKRGPFPRVSTETLHLDELDAIIPSGTRVFVYSWAIHRDAALYARPAEWSPYRWLRDDLDGFPERHTDFSRGFLVFGTGDRSCPGLDFALYEMKTLLWAIYSKYQTELADEKSYAYDLPFTPRNGFHDLNVLFQLAASACAS